MLAKSAVTLALVLGLCALTISHGHAKVGKTISVDCDKKETLAAAISAAVEGDTINVSGECNERVTIDLDNLTLDGGGTAVIDGTGVGGTSPLLRVFASNITIRDITVQDSPGHGIQIRGSGSATIQGTIVQDNAGHGIVVVQNSDAFIGAGSGNHDNPGTPGSEGNIISGNGVHGVNIRLSSSARLFHNDILGNGQAGISLSEGASAGIDGNNITGNRRGIQLNTNSSVRLSDQPNHGGRAGFPEPNLIQENTKAGVFCRLGGALRGEPQDFGTGNPGTGDHTDDTDISGDCPEASSLAFPP